MGNLELCKWLKSKQPILDVINARDSNGSTPIAAMFSQGTMVPSFAMVP